MRKSIKKFFQDTEWVYQLVSKLLLVWYIGVLLLPVPAPIWFYLALPLIHSLLMFLYKDFARTPMKTFNSYRLAMLVFASTILFYARKWIDYTFDIKIPVLAILMFVVVIIIGTAYLLYGSPQKKKNFANTLYFMSFLDGVKGSSSEDEKLNVVICKTPEGKNVIWGGLDRFLHLLIIGPTGCGKTSLILIPLIRQDIMKHNAVTVIDPKGDLAELVYAMGVEYNNPVIYFNPIFPDCPYFNPLEGSEERVVETMTTIFKMLTPDSKTYFEDMANDLIRKALMVLKRLEMAYYNFDTGISSKPATLISLSDLINNTEGRGRKMIQEFGQLPTLSEDEKKQNSETRDYFLNNYYSERSKEYEHTSGVRKQVANLIQNPHLRRVFNPPDGKSQVNFDECLAFGKNIAISTAQGELRELSTYLGYFIIFSLQASIFRREGTEDDRIPNFLYIDEFQKYANSGFEDILTLGRSYRVSAILATQARGLIGNTDKRFLDAVDANCRNVVLFSGISSTDAKYFSEFFGEHTEVVERKSFSHDKTSLLSSGRTNTPKETISYDERNKPNFTASELIYSGFKEIKYKLIVDNNVKEPAVGEVSWIDYNLNQRLKQTAKDYRLHQLAILEEHNEERLRQKKELYQQYRISKGVEKAPVVDGKTVKVPPVSQLGAKVKKETLEDSIANSVPEPTLNSQNNVEFASNEAEWNENDEFIDEEEEMLLRTDYESSEKPVYEFD